MHVLVQMGAFWSILARPYWRITTATSSFGISTTLLGALVPKYASMVLPSFVPLRVSRYETTWSWNLSSPAMTSLQSLM